MPESGGSELCDYLTWDSTFWGFPIAQVRSRSLVRGDVHKIDRWCKDQSIACLYFLAVPDDPTTVQAAEDGRFRFTDIRVTLDRAAKSLPSEATEVSRMTLVVRPSVADDVGPLERIAAVSHRDTRFFFDLHFPRAKCERLYEQWLANSCCGYADRVLVAVDEDVPVGYITGHLPSQGETEGRIGLVGVGPGWRGRGIGKTLVIHALDWFAQQGVERVTVITQGRNIAAQRLYQRCGFTTQSQYLWYHKWYRPLAPDKMA